MPDFGLTDDIPDAGDLDAVLDDAAEDDDSDAEDFVARSSDAYVVVAQASDEHSVLEVYCYEENTGNLFGTC